MSFKDPNIKNWTYWFFNDIIYMIFKKIKKLYENVLVSNVSCKSPTGPKLLRIKFDKTDGSIISLDGEIKHLVLFHYGLLDRICDKTEYPISKKSGITNSINYNFGKIIIDSYISLPLKKIMTFHNVIILIKSLVNKNILLL